MKNNKYKKIPPTSPSRLFTFLDGVHKRNTQNKTVESGKMKLYPDDLLYKSNDNSNIKPVVHIPFKKNIKQTDTKNDDVNIKEGRAISQLIASRQSWNCALCKDKLPPGFIGDHILPRCVGGTNEQNNLHALCTYCNYFKTYIVDPKIREVEKNENRKLTKHEIIHFIRTTYFKIFNHHIDYQYRNNRPLLSFGLHCFRFTVSRNGMSFTWNN